MKFLSTVLILFLLLVLVPRKLSIALNHRFVPLNVELMLIRFTLYTTDPVDLIFNGLTIKRSKPKIKEKLLELGLAADRTELHKKRSKKSNQGECSLSLSSRSQSMAACLALLLSLFSALSPVWSDSEAPLILANPIPFHSHLSFLLSSDSATIPIRSVFC